MTPRDRGQSHPKRAPDGARRAHEKADVPEETTTNLAGTEADDAVAAQERAHQTDELFARMHAGDARARDALIERFLPLARQLARRYQRAAEPLDDLVQVASIGLVKAVDRFDDARGVAFSSYAVPTILGELKRYFRDSGWAVHVPRGMQERAMQVDRAIKELGGRFGRSPSVDEVAEHTHSSVEDVLGAMEAGQAYEAVSLEQRRAQIKRLRVCNEFLADLFVRTRPSPPGQVILDLDAIRGLVSRLEVGPLPRRAEQRHGSRQTPPRF